MGHRSSVCAAQARGGKGSPSICPFFIACAQGGRVSELLHVSPLCSTRYAADL